MAKKVTIQHPRGASWSSGIIYHTRRQGLRVRIPSPTFSFEECIVSGWPREEDEEQEQEQEDHGRVKQEERGRRRRHSDQERLRERLSVQISNSIKW